MEKTQKLTIRHDDFDFRMSLEHYQGIHEQFIEASLVETAVIQFTRMGKLIDFDANKRSVVGYLNLAPNWELQLHGWTHHIHPKAMSFDDTVKDLAACIFLFEKYFNRRPTIWYPQWNEKTPATERAAEVVGLAVETETTDIEKFIPDAYNGKFDHKSVYFHGWRKPEYDMISKMIEVIKEHYYG